VVTAIRSAGAGSLLGATSVAAVGGVATFSNLAHPYATNITLAFTSGSLTPTNSSLIAVNPGPFSQLQLLLPGETAAPATPTGKTGTPTAQTAGIAFSGRVNAVDAYWNTANTNVAVVGLKSSDTMAALPTSVALVNGTNSFSVTMNTPGNQMVTAAYSTMNATSAPVAVNTGTAVRLLVLMPGEIAAPGTPNGKTGTPTAQTAGTPFTVTVNAVDVNWNLAASTHTVAITSSDTSAVLPANAALSGGVGTFAVTFKAAGSWTVTVTETSASPLLSSTSSLTAVSPGAFTKLQVLLPGESAAPGSATGKTGAPNAQTAGTAFNGRVNAVDANWNLVITNIASVGLTSSDSIAVLPASIGLVNGTNAFNVTMKVAGSQTVMATYLTMNANSAPVLVNAGAVVKLLVLMPGETAAPGTLSGKMGTPAPVRVGVGFSVAVNAADAYWNQALTSDLIHLSASDSSAVLPKDTFLNGGRALLNLTNNTSGNQSMTVSDVTNPVIQNGTVNYAVVPTGLGLPAQSDRAVNELGLLMVTNTAFNLSSTNGVSAGSLVTTNAIVFSYADRSALLADGWSYLATTAGGIPRNTEITNPLVGAVVSYDQTAHPGVLRIPCDVGDLWAGDNTSRNSLFRNLPADWVSLRLALAFAPTIDYQQVHLSVYQDDDNFIQAGMAHNDFLGGEITTLVWELNAVPGHFVTALGPVTSIRFRLDRNPSNGDISGYCSFDGVTWNLLGTHNISLANTRLCIWVGGSPVPYAAGMPVCDLQRLEMVSSNSAPMGVAYQLVNAPAGANIDGNGIIAWTPSEAQGPGTNVITTIATDYNAPGGPASVSNSFTVVVNEVNTAPVLPAQLNRVIGGQTTLTLNNTATDTDIPPNPLNYQLVTPPAGAVIDTNGVITWTPTPNQVPSTNVFTTVVTDFNPWAINAQHLSATNSFTVYVVPGATPNGPVLLGQIARTINEQTTLVVTNTAIENLTSSQLATNTYQFAYADRNALLADGWNFLATLPGGATRNTEITNPAVGALASYDQTAHPGVLGIPCDLGDLWAAANNTRNSLFRSLPANWVSLRLALTFAPVANYQQVHLALYQDDDNYVAAGVAYNSGLKAAQDREVGGLPSTLTAATITASNVQLRLDRDPTTSTFTTLYSVNGTTWVTLQQVSQGLVNPRVCIWVGGAQTAYVAGMPVCDLQRLEVVVSNAGPTAVAYQLVGAPAGAAIDGNGIITWTPAEAQGPATNVLVTVATDNGQPPLSATNSFTVVVNEVNQAPVLPAQSDLTLTGQTLLMVTNTATDADIPSNTLTYQLLAAPANAVISSKGVITWTPAAGQVPSTNSFVTVVTDSNPWAVNAQHLSATNSFTVTVATGAAAGRQVGQLVTSAGQVSIALSYSATDTALQLSFTGTPGRDYQIVWSSQLGGSWTPLATVTADAQGQVRYTGAKPAARAFFRLRLP
jgi:hypothetical protein